MRFRELVETHRALRRTRARKEKVALLATCLRALGPEERRAGVAWLAGRLPQGKVGLGWAAVRDARTAPAATTPSLAAAEVDRVFGELAGLSGPGAGRLRREAFEGLLARATAEERELLCGLALGEVRQGASEGLVVEAVARAAEVPLEAVRRAVMVRGDLGEVAEAALEAGAPALERFRIELFRPVLPMLAQPAEDPSDALADGAASAFEWKLDGARVQIHKRDDEVRVYTRRLNEVTDAVPETVGAARALRARELIADGEVIALARGGDPHPFQTTMRRFGRRLDVARLREELPLSVFLFDCLRVDGDDLTPRPEHERQAALAGAADEALRVPRLVTADAAAAGDFYRDALGRGHEGLMAKALDAPYAAGGRGRAWLKLKPSHTLDLVVLAAEWGSGRREGWLSNLHLGARDEGSGAFVMLGKTFKGLTDELLGWQTERLLALETRREGHVVFVEPRLVVEVALGGVQTSPHYPAGLALRFARVKRYRPDKDPGAADTLAAVRALHDAAA